MKAIAVFPGKPNSAHLAELPKPSVGEITGGRGVLVRVVRVGVDGTDREINAGEYGAAPQSKAGKQCAPPEGCKFLIIGHENFGQVEEVGPNVTALRPGDYVVATVRRPGASLYDQIGTYDMTTEDAYLERGINLLHGFLAEYYVDEAEYLVPVPPSLKEVAVLLEPFSVIEKGLTQAYETQRRLRIWRPQRAAVMGAGTIGLLAALALRSRGLEVTTFDLKPKSSLNADLVEALGGRYLSTADRPMLEGAQDYGPFDLIFEATGFSPVAFESMQALGKNAVLILASVTEGDRTIEVPSDKINLEFVLGNKVMVGTVSANRAHFEMCVRTMAHAEAAYPGWLGRLLTHPVKGLENYKELFNKLTTAKEAIKIFCEVANF